MRQNNESGCIQKGKDHSGGRKMNKYDVAAVLTTYSQQLINIDDMNDTKAIKKQIEKLREDLKDIEKQIEVQENE